MKDTRPRCPYCQATTWNKDFVAWMRDHDRPQGGLCLQAAEAYKPSEAK